MKKYLLLPTLLFLFTGCTTNVCIPGEGRPIIAGTGTQVVKISLDAAGNPAVDVEPVFVLPGETVVFAGPADFTIRFAKDSPADQREFKAEDGAVSVRVPEREFSKSRFFKAIENVELKRLLQPETKGLRVYKYDVIVNGRVLDPHFILPE